MMSADGLVVAMARGAVEDGGDLRAAAGRGDVDVVRAVQRGCEQIDERDEHGQQPAPIARTASCRRLTVREHDVTQVAVCARPSMAAGTVSTRNIVTSREQLPQRCVVASHCGVMTRRCATRKGPSRNSPAEAMCSQSLPRDLGRQCASGRFVPTYFSNLERSSNIAISDRRNGGGRTMDGLIYLIGLIVVIMAILSFFGLR